MTNGTEAIRYPEPRLRGAGDISPIVYWLLFNVAVLSFIGLVV